MHADGLRIVCETLAPGAIRMVGAPSVADTLAQIDAFAESCAKDRRVLTIAWETPPAPRVAFEQAIDAMAELAAALWPEWSPDPPDPDPRAPQSSVDNSAIGGPIVDAVWRKLADEACRRRALPRFADQFSAAVETRQLSLVLGTPPPLLALAIHDQGESEESLAGWSRVVEWLARETRFPVIAVVPVALLRAPALDSISFDAVELASPDEPATDEPWTTSESSRETGKDAQSVSTRDRLRPRSTVGSIIGRPHPQSPGENALWLAIQNDRELAPVFVCNQPFETALGSRFIVDFLCATGKLIVEVDGFRAHGSRWAFARDRQRDYELLLADHRVVRLTHDEVMEDVGRALEKVRRLVRRVVQ